MNVMNKNKVFSKSKITWNSATFGSQNFSPVKPIASVTPMKRVKTQEDIAKDRIKSTTAFVVNHPQIKNCKKPVVMKNKEQPIETDTRQKTFLKPSGETSAWKRRKLTQVEPSYILDDQPTDLTVNKKMFLPEIKTLLSPNSQKPIYTSMLITVLTFGLIFV